MHQIVSHTLNTPIVGVGFPGVVLLTYNIVRGCRDPMSTIQATSSTSKQDTLDQLRELYHAVKKQTKKKEEEASHHYKEDGQSDPSHFPNTATSRNEQREEERRQMNELPHQQSADINTYFVQL